LKHRSTINDHARTTTFYSISWKNYDFCFLSYFYIGFSWRILSGLTTMDLLFVIDEKSNQRSIF
jgi:hypothetical protein